MFSDYLVGCVPVAANAGIFLHSRESPHYTRYPNCMIGVSVCVVMLSDHPAGLVCCPHMCFHVHFSFLFIELGFFWCCFLGGLVVLY